MSQKLSLALVMSSSWAKRCYPIKIMWWFTVPTFIDLFSIYIFTVPNMNRIILSWNLFLLHDKSWKIITESSWSIPVSNKRMWLGGMVDLCSRVRCFVTNTNSEKITLGSRVSFDSRVESKSNHWNSHSFFINGMFYTKLVIQYLYLCVRE